MKQITETPSIHGLIDLSLRRSISSVELTNVTVRCSYCNNELSDRNWYRRHQEYRINYCVNCINREPTLKKYKQGRMPMGFISKQKGNKIRSPNRRSIATEYMLRRMYNDVEHIGGSRFICDNDDIQMSSSSKVVRKNGYISWVFKCDRVSMDYYICFAYEGKIYDSELEHVWRIPSNVVSHLNNLTITNTSIEDWACYDMIDNKIDDPVDNSYVARDNLEISKYVLSQHLGPLSPIDVKSRLNLIADGCNFHIATTNGIIKNGNKLWVFSTSYKPTDYFLCLAFSDKEGSELEHIWIIPSTIIKGSRLTIPESQFDKWAEYDYIKGYDQLI